jgi:predicted ATPase
LKDLPGDHHLLQLHHSDLVGGVRAPRVSEAARTNLPVPRSAFVGRVPERADVRALLREHRLVTIVGSGGAGKTRLALEVARAHVGEGFNGVWLVELATSEPSDDLVTVIAAALGLLGGPDPLGVVARRLGDGAQLLVLDNCEHLLDAAAQTAVALSDICPSLRLLATSREPLGVDGERVWRIPSLSVPTEAAGADAIKQSDAVLLFLERARSASASITDDQLGDVAAICRRLDGIPLAIELAAARVRALSPRQLLDRLDDAFRLLVSSSRGVVPRQQTLRATIEWSHDLLSEPERILLRRLAVFVGTFALDTVEAVCSDDAIDAFLAVDLLTMLVDRSMVILDGTTDTRYRLLESVRQFATEQLERAGERVVFQRRHLSWYTELGAVLADRIVDGDREALRQADTDEPNLEAALVWAADHDPAAAEQLAAHLAFYWFARTRMSEAMRWLQRLFGDNNSVDSPDRLRLLLGTAMALREAGGETDDVRSLAERGVAMAARLGDPTFGAYFNSVLALLPGPDRAALADEADRLARQTDDLRVQGFALGVAVRVLGDDGLYEDAAQRLDELRSRIAEHPSPAGYMTVLIAEADLFLLTGRPADAVNAARSALETAAELNEQTRLIILIALGAAWLDVPDLDAAYEAYERVFAIGRRISDVGSQGIALSGFAAIAAGRSQFEISARVLGAALTIPRTPASRPTSRWAYELADRLCRAALADRFGSVVAEGALLSPEAAAALLARV